MADGKAAERPHVCGTRTGCARRDEVGTSRTTGRTQSKPKAGWDDPESDIAGVATRVTRFSHCRLLSFIDSPEFSLPVGPSSQRLDPLYQACAGRPRVGASTASSRKGVQSHCNAIARTQGPSTPVTPMRLFVDSAKVLPFHLWKSVWGRRASCRAANVRSLQRNETGGQPNPDCISHQVSGADSTLRRLAIVELLCEADGRSGSD